jgi:hypothetical protein
VLAAGYRTIITSSLLQGQKLQKAGYKLSQVTERWLQGDGDNILVTSDGHTFVYSLLRYHYRYIVSNGRY